MVLWRAALYTRRLCLGLTPGTYVWTWGTGLENQNFTLVIGGSVPDGGTTVMLLGMAFGALGMARRFLLS